MPFPRKRWPTAKGAEDVNLVYRSTNEGVGTEVADAVGATLSQLKRKLDEHKPRAAEARGEAPMSVAPAAQPPSAERPSAAPTQCPGCGAPVDADDMFCGHCGHRLR